MFRPYTVDITTSTEDAADEMCAVLNRQANIFSSNVVRDGIKCLWFTSRVNSQETHDTLTALVRRHFENVESYTRSERD